MVMNAVIARTFGFGASAAGSSSAMRTPSASARFRCGIVLAYVVLSLKRNERTWVFIDALGWNIPTRMVQCSNGFGTLCPDSHGELWPGYLPLIQSSD